MLDLTVAHALRLLRNGATVDQALRESAHEHGTSIAAVRRHARATNIVLTPDGKPRATHTFTAKLSEEAQEAAIARVGVLVGEGMTQTAALALAAQEAGCSIRTIERAARKRGATLPVADAARQRNVANASLSSHIITVQRQRDLVQVLLRVADTGISMVEAQARKGGEHVDWTLMGRLTTKLGELHTLDNALVLQAGRFDATLSREENAKRAAESTLSEADEYAAQWERDRQAFGVDVMPEPSGTEG